MTKAILVTGATGKQGGAAINALLAAPDAAEYKILAVTRDPSSSSAHRLAAKSDAITLIKGDLNDVPSVFAEAQAAAGSEGIYGVISNPAVAFGGKTEPIEETQEVRQGVAIFDEAKRAGVKHFIYLSVDRGGEARSWENPTDVPHFRTKHYLEHYVRDNAGPGMKWTILRPVIFMDNLAGGMMGKIVLTYAREWMGPERKMYWVDIVDIGYFAALAFRSDEITNKALTVASDYVSFDDINAVFEKVTGAPAPTTYVCFTWPMRLVAEMRNMFRWFAQEGYVADLDYLRKLDPGLTSFETWVRNSEFAKK